DYPDPLVFEPLQLPHRQTFILLHGRGSWAEKFGPELLRARIETSQPDQSGSSKCETMTLQTAFPHARFVFPTAARRRATIYKRALTHQWFDSWKLDPPATEREELQIEGLRETTLYLHQLLRSEIAVVPGGAENVVLGGLSQGCAASLVALLLWEGENLGAVVGMCGWLPFTKSLMTEVRGEEEEHNDVDELGFNPFTVDACDTDNLDHKTADTPAQKAIGWLREQLDLPALKVSSDTLPVQKIPIFLAHGAQDEKVSIQLGRRAAECLENLGAGVCWKEYEELGHWYSPEMLKDLLHFLLETFGDPENP
ncbi:Alpha/Beta hydrolase protein, partial [Diaporthe sp. PMI_573]